MPPTRASSAPRPTPAKRRSWQQLRASDLRAAARLATQATTGVTHIVEGVHQSVRATIGLPGGRRPGSTGGLTGLVYRSIEGSMRWIDRSLQTALLRLEPWLDRALAAPETGVDAEREALLSALNGVMGDRLAADDNPLALPMQLRQQGLPLDMARLGQPPKLLLLVHGLCMNDLQWQAGGHDHGAYLAQEKGYCPVYLRYNSGLPIAENGRALAAQLDALLAAWPGPLEHFAAIGHSMGGLVLRAALHSAQQAGMAWPQALRQLVFLGSPHQGAPLERAGHGVDLLLASTPYSRPFTRLARLRSAGITDLRHGQITDEPKNPSVPLPPGLACYTVAATLAARRSCLSDRLLGDGLVPLHSALGRHTEPARRLAFAPERQHIAYQTGHLQLLSDPEVAQLLLQWLE